MEPARDSGMIHLIGEGNIEATCARLSVHGAFCPLPGARPCVTRLTNDPAKCLPDRAPTARSAAELIMTFDIIKAAILGVVEGLTEFVPVSSTGHLLLLEHFFGFGDEDFGKSFTVLIQFGAILALLSIYAVRLWQLAVGVFNDAQSRRFVIGVLVAFLPAAVLGALAYKFIKEVLFNPWVVCVSLIVGGLVLLWVDRLNLKPRYNEATRFTLPMYLVIGLAQCVSMIPGVSRSGATIVSAMLLGADRR